MITGASSGIGKAAAQLFAQKGHQVVAVSRDVEKMKSLQSSGCLIFPMDITREESIQEAFRQIYAAVEHIDVLVNNAGYYQNGFVEELGMENLRYQFEVNVFGLVRVTQMVLPGMRRKKAGHIINIGSVGGDFTSAGASAYHATKYALESLTDGMRQELGQFGIKVVLVKPGGVATELMNNAYPHFPEPVEGNPYGKMRENLLNTLADILNTSKSAFPILKPEEVAREIFISAVDSKPKTRVRIGTTAKMMPLMKHLMSDKAFDKMILQQLGLTK